MLDELVSTNRSLLQLVAADAGRTLKESTDVMYRLGYNNELREILLSGVSERDCLETQMSESDRLSRIIGPLTIGPYVNQVRIYFRERKIYARDSYKYFHMSDAERLEWYPKVIANPGEICWSSPYLSGEDPYANRTFVSAARSILLSRESEEVLAFVEVQLNIQRLFVRVMRSFNSVFEGIVYIVNDTGRVNGSLNSAHIGLPIYMMEGLGRVNLRDKEPQYLGNNVVISLPMQGSDWKVVGRIPLDRYTRERNRILKDFVKWGAVIFTVALVLSVLFSEILSRRLKRLLKTFSEKHATSKKDEIVVLEELFDSLEQENITLANEIFREQIQKQEAQLSVLQAQIDPHFLYNILDTINWVAIKGGNRDVSEIVVKLAKFYRARLSGGRSLITIKEEIECTQAYIDLQKTRFHNNIELDLKFEDAIMDCLVFGMLLQPLVENSIKHGFLKRAGQSGRIEMRGWTEGSEIIITVQDNGIGLTREEAERITNEENVAQNARYGFLSVNKRISLLFGAKYRAVISPGPNGNGALVRINIPLMRA
ncbi:histidine kinase [Synergistaceae bacterium OttesenSCG-928-I11]|nr:histidine kinase [Synergistaceae bacterium OttesenSCG-928-I11]